MTGTVIVDDLEALLDQAPAEPDHRYCHLQATRYDAGKRVWAGDRPLCGSPSATRCPGPRLTTGYAGEKLCPACGRPYCPQCIAQRPGATS